MREIDSAVRPLAIEVPLWTRGFDDLAGPDPAELRDLAVACFVAPLVDQLAPCLVLLMLGWAKTSKPAFAFQCHPRQPAMTIANEDCTPG